MAYVVENDKRESDKHESLNLTWVVGRHMMLREDCYKRRHPRRTTCGSPWKAQMKHPAYVRLSSRRALPYRVNSFRRAC